MIRGQNAKQKKKKNRSVSALTETLARMEMFFIYVTQ